MGGARVLRALPASIERSLRLSFVVWIFAFGVYATTASPHLHGYDPQAAESAEGFLETGRFEIPEDALFGDPGDAGVDGKRVSRVGLPEAALMVPFYAIGSDLDDAAPRPDGRESFRALALGFYEPFIAATAAALLFLIVLRIRRSIGWAVAIAVLFTVATIAWPYSKVGMETTVMLGMVVTLVGIVYARAGNRAPWVVAGFGAGMTVAAKAYELPAVLILIALLWPLLRMAPAAQRLRLVSYVAAPALLWVVAIGLYNLSREGSPFDFGQASFSPTSAAPINAVGFFLSPGKGLLWYSPLVILGIVGLKDLAVRQRRLAVTFVAVAVAATVVVAINVYWSDETWGPRYIVPIAWLFLLPIPFWAVTRRRRAILGATAAVAVVVQLVGVIAPYESTVQSSPALLGQNLLSKERGRPPLPLGDDSVRWVPQLSPLIHQGALVTSWASSGLGLGPLTLGYNPWEGQQRSFRITPEVTSALGIPDFWWLPRHNGLLGLGVLLSVFSAVVAGFVLARATLTSAYALSAGEGNRRIPARQRTIRAGF
jgi:hypothetical protein